MSQKVHDRPYGNTTEELDCFVVGNIAQTNSITEFFSCTKESYVEFIRLLPRFGTGGG